MKRIPLGGTLRKNVVANFAGSIWQALMGLAFIPLYIRFLGVASFGLLGFFATLQTMFGLLDLGLSATLTRELARLSSVPDSEGEMRDLVRSLEWIYWGAALVIGGVVMAASSLIARHWVHASTLSPDVVQRTIFTMGIVIALQWPSSLYSGGLIGLQNQVLLNGINIAAATVRNVGVVLILWLVSPTIEAYLVWQGITTAAMTAVLGVYFWRVLPRAAERPRFRPNVVLRLWRFAAGMSTISVLAVMLTQVDKVVLSRVLSLEAFGYYTLASTAASSLTRLFTPMFYSIYPRFTQLVSLGDEGQLAALYHKASQFMSVLVVPAACVVSLFSRPILLLWTRDAAIADSTYLLLSVLIWGTALNGIMNPPYALQLAFGWTRLNIAANAVAVAVLVPGTVLLSLRFGALGAASAWFLLNLGYVLFMTPVMHGRILRGEMWRWYRSDVGAPLAASLIVAGVCRLVLPVLTDRLLSSLALVLVATLTLAAGALSSRWMRSQVRALRQAAA